jgi:hypothetical protein
MASTQVQDTRTVSPSQAIGRVKTAFRTKRPVFLWGPPGIGKSDIVEQIAIAMEGHMVDVRMSLMEPTDLRGIPFYNKDTGLMEWAPPVDLPTEEFCSQFPIVILFLDEMNAAPPSVQAAGYQLILNRRVGTYVLPDNVVIIAAGNRESDKGSTYRMPTPLANRFTHLEMKVEFDSWFEWAVANEIHEDVVGFLSAAKQDLFDFNPRSPSRSFATPRTWTFVSQYLKEENDPEILVDLIAGTVGEGAAIKFMTHRKHSHALPNVDDVLSGKVTEMTTKEISAMYSLVISMCYELKDKHSKVDTQEWHKMADCFFLFMMENFNTEITVMGAKVALTSYNLPFQPGRLKHFDRFHKAYGKYIMNAVQKP